MPAWFGRKRAGGALNRGEVFSCLLTGTFTEAGCQGYRQLGAEAGDAVEGGERWRPGVSLSAAAAAAANGDEGGRDR